jgi:hypothetical protein
MNSAQLCGFWLLAASSVLPLAASLAAAHPELLEAPLTQISQLEEISKFRSGAGHDFSYDASFPFGASDSSEPPSSMKHYLAPLPAYSGDRVTIPVYAPLAGVITRVTEETNGAIVNKRVEIVSIEDPSYLLILFHIDLDEAYPQILEDWPIEFWPSHQEDDDSYVTTTVAPGDLLGYADMRTGHDFDVAVLWTDTDGERYWVSYFDLMPDAIFSRFTARGLQRSDLRVSKVERLATPVTWWGGRDEHDWLALARPVPMLSWGGPALIACLTVWVIARGLDVADDQVEQS